MRNYSVPSYTSYRKDSSSFSVFSIEVWWDLMLLSLLECRSGSGTVVKLCSEPHLVSNLSVVDVDHFWNLQFTHLQFYLELWYSNFISKSSNSSDAGNSLETSWHLFRLTVIVAVISQCHYPSYWEKFPVTDLDKYTRKLMWKLFLLLTECYVSCNDFFFFFFKLKEMSLGFQKVY